MNGIGPGEFRSREQGCDIEVAFGRGRRPDAHRLVRLPHMACTGIRVAEHRDRAIAEGLRGADDAARNLAAIGDQDFVERDHDVRSPRERQ